jgi:RsiW-degrading membrane proteinase PrsW (M82 family)
MSSEFPLDSDDSYELDKLQGYYQLLANGIMEETLKISGWAAGMYVIIAQSENHMDGSV